jgi:hypothetical protein
LPSGRLHLFRSRSSGIWIPPIQNAELVGSPLSGLIIWNRFKSRPKWPYQWPVFSNISWPPGLKFAPRDELSPEGWTLSPRGIFHPFVHPQGGTLSNV